MSSAYRCIKILRKKIPAILGAQCGEKSKRIYIHKTGALTDNKASTPICKLLFDRLPNKNASYLSTKLSDSRVLHSQFTLYFTDHGRHKFCFEKKVSNPDFF